MDLTGYSPVSAASAVTPAISEFQRACSTSVLHSPISFQEGDNVTDFGHRIECYARLSTDQALHPLHCLSGLLDNCDSLDMLPGFLIPPSMRSTSTAPLRSCLRRRIDVTAIAQTFCGGTQRTAKF